MYCVQLLSFQCHFQDNLEANNFLILQFCFSSSSVMVNNPGFKNTTAAEYFMFYTCLGSYFASRKNYIIELKKKYLGREHSKLSYNFNVSY